MNTIGSRRWWALGAIALAVFAVTLDVTVLTVALPTLAGSLNASEAQLQWFVTAYTLALVAGMLPAGNFSLLRSSKRTYHFARSSRLATSGGAS